MKKIALLFLISLLFSPGIASAQSVEQADLIQQVNDLTNQLLTLQIELLMKQVEELTRQLAALQEQANFTQRALIQGVPQIDEAGNEYLCRDTYSLIGNDCACAQGLVENAGKCEAPAEQAKSQIKSAAPTINFIYEGIKTQSISSGVNKDIVFNWEVLSETPASCEGSGSWNGKQDAIGSKRVSFETDGNYDFTLVCRNKDAEAVGNLLIVVRGWNK